VSLVVILLTRLHQAIRVRTRRVVTNVSTLGDQFPMWGKFSSHVDPETYEVSLQCGETCEIVYTKFSEISGTVSAESRETCAKRTGVD